jgi:uncharacterized protein
MRSYVAWPIVAAFTYGALYFLANRAIYYPLRNPEGLWDEQQRLGATDVWLKTDDGVRLHAWWVRREDARLVTLFLHGNAGNVTHRSPHIREIVGAGSSILIPDFRGYGKSEGRPTERGLFADGEAAYQYLTRAGGYRPDQIVIHGESLGTAIAVDLAARHPCAGVVLEASFTSASDVAATILPVLGPMLVRSFNSARKIGRVRAPMFFLHGDRDDIIPIRIGQALFAAAPQPKSLWIVEGAGHNDILETAGPRYREHLASFYSRL